MLQGTHLFWDQSLIFFRSHHIKVYMGVGHLLKAREEIVDPGHLEMASCRLTCTPTGHESIDHDFFFLIN